MKTRMERYKELREKMSNEVNHNVENHALSEYANRLNKIDDEAFENMVDTNPNYEPNRAKEVDLKKYETFENEYLKDFLDEVKSYNIEKGNRLVEDTEQNILEEINAQNQNQPTLGTKEAPLGLEDLEAFEQATVNSVVAPSEPLEVNDKIEDVIHDSQAYNFDQMLESVTNNTDLVNNESPVFDDFFMDASPHEVEAEVPLEEETIDTNSLIDSLQSGNFMAKGAVEPMVKPIEDDIFANIRTFDLELEQESKAQAEEIFKQDPVDLESLRLNPNKSNSVDDDFEYEENFDPFWEDYLQKMNALEDSVEPNFDQNKDSLNFPRNRSKKIVIADQNKEERDITQEFLALTREIERENLESIDLTGKTMEEMAVVGNKEKFVTENKLSAHDDFGSSVVTGKGVKKNRAVNAILTVALAGIVLAVAFAIKYFLLS